MVPRLTQETTTMAKLTDAQLATLTRGAQHPNGFIRPTPKTPAPMALQAAKKLEALGLVEQVPCFHDEPFYLIDEDSGDFVGFRVTAAGFEALGIDGAEWPAYATQDAGADAPAPVADMPKEWEAPGPSEQQMDLDDAAAERAAYQAEQEAELAAEEAADQPLVSAADLAASLDAASTVVALARGSLRDAAAAFLAAWYAGPMNAMPNSDLVARVEALRAAMPAAKAPKAPKVAGEPGEPRSGSKAALVIGLLQRPGGATAAQIEEATGWTNTSTRGFISSLKIKRGLAVETAKIAKVTHYWIGSENAPEVPIETTKEAPGAKGGEQPAF